MIFPCIKGVLGLQIIRGCGNIAGNYGNTELVTSWMPENHLHFL